jgi:hypothetical protein
MTPYMMFYFLVTMAGNPICLASIFNNPWLFVGNKGEISRLSISEEILPVEQDLFLAGVFSCEQ